MSHCAFLNGAGNKFTGRNGLEGAGGAIEMSLSVNMESASAADTGTSSSEGLALRTI